jgi:predicted CXXCH cytochrome family protein
MKAKIERLVPLVSLVSNLFDVLCKPKFRLQVYMKMRHSVMALMFALLAAGITLVVASAQADTGSASAQTSSQDCAVCHTEFETTWQSGAHGQAGSDPVFVGEWTKQGKPGACLVCHTTGYDPATATYKADGVTCEACHGPAPADHPKSPMPVNRTTDLCGQCHSDTRFGWQDWKVSTHYQRGMECTTCHDPHSTSLKKAPGPRTENTTDDVSPLCINCHKETSTNFSHTAHNQKGVSCVDCHVNYLETTDRTAHSVPDHSFNASLESCNTCHAQQMHSPTEAMGVTEVSAPVAPESTAEIELASVSAEPDSVSPVGFSVMAGMIGLAGGMVLAPWLERWYRHISKHDTEESNDQTSH